MNKLKRFSILLLVLLSFSCSSFAKTDNIIYLIPEEYEGGVIILYTQDGVTPETKEDGTIIYRIPKDGFLTVKPPSKGGPYSFHYYYVNDKGNRTPIEYLHPAHYVRDPDDTTSKSFDTITENEQNNETFIIDHRNIGFEVQSKKVLLNGFIVGKPKNGIQLRVNMDLRIDKIQRELENETQP